MTLLYVTYPILLLAAACTGYGLLAMRLFYRDAATLPAVLHLVASYFLGQGLLAGLFILLGAGGVFKFAIVLGLILAGAILCPFLIWPHRHALRHAGARPYRIWLQTPWPWRVIIILAVGLYAYGVSTMGRPVDGDAAAFYLAASKLIAFSGHVGKLPGYEDFSWVIMTGEILNASLTLLGAPGTSSRLYDWANYLPLLLAFYSVARLCNLSARAAFLAVVMALTSSAALVLWGGGKTDSFAVGPAFIAVWFAIASWNPDRRHNLIALSGLFCAFAIVAKFSYVVPLLPGIMLLIHWHDILAAFADLRALAVKPLFQRAIRMLLVSAWFGLFLVLGLLPFMLKNIVVFHAPFGSGSTGLAAWLSSSTTFRLVLTYPFALTYGRYWGQLGTLSPLILAFIPLFFLIPRRERGLSTPLSAITISTAVAIGIWLILMPSIFMPRYMLATLLLLGIPAAAGAAYVSRQPSRLAGVILSATAAVILLTPSHVNSRSPVFDPMRALMYLRDGDEEKLFYTDAYTMPTTVVNRESRPNDRVLLLVYPRLWLRGDLLAATATNVEFGRVTDLLEKPSAEFWNYVQEKKFAFMIVNNFRNDKFTAVMNFKPPELELCEISSHGGITAFQIGKECRVCPAGNRTVLKGPFYKPWADGKAYVANIPEFEDDSDFAGNPFRSTLALCEGERRLWQAHTMSDEIRADGHGRYSHWGKQLAFSTSDDSDPNTNGRTYSVTLRR